MKIAYITQIRNEENLIFNNLLYHYNIGIRDFFIIFNRSNPETWAEVNRFSNAFKDHYITTMMDMSTEYNQPEAFNNLSDMIYSRGYKWVIPVDADELLVIPKGKTIQDCLRIHDEREYGYIRCEWYDYHPKDTQLVSNYFTDWKYRENTPRKAGKCIVKWVSGMKWGDGHHLIITQRKKIADAQKLYYAHFPNRTLEQFVDKKINIGNAFIEKYGPESTKPQVVQLQKFREDPEFFKKQYLDIMRFRRTADLVYDPISPELFK